jgi:hypothetical protein
MKTMRMLAVAVMVIGSVTLGGCASARTGHADLGAWRSELEKYVNSDAGGDINQIRTLAPPDEQPIFADLGGEDPDGSTDVFGLLLGRRMIESRSWYVFLVTTVGGGQHMKDIQLAAVSVQGGRYDWRVSGPDKAAFDRYAKSVARYVELSPDPVVRWKSGADVFGVQVAGSTINVVHAPSGAMWKLDVNARNPASGSGGRVASGGAGTPVGQGARTPDKPAPAAAPKPTVVRLDGSE